MGQRQKVNSKNSLFKREERKLFQEIKGKPERDSRRNTLHIKSDKVIHFSSFLLATT